MIALPLWAQAGAWGLVAGTALLIGAGIGYFAAVPKRVIAGVMAFGSGVLISALTFELMEKAYEHGGFGATATGFICGAMLYTAANWMLTKQGAKHRKRSDGRHDSPHGEDRSGANGLAMAVGALLDGIPESIVIGLSLLQGGNISVVAVTAIFLSNLPEGLSSAAGMKKRGRSALYVFSIWGTIAFTSGVAALLGYALFEGLSHEVVAATIAVAAGAVLAMLVDTMIPEAFEDAHDFAGLITAAGFLAAFALTKLSH